MRPGAHTSCCVLSSLELSDCLSGLGLKPLSRAWLSAPGECSNCTLNTVPFPETGKCEYDPLSFDLGPFLDLNSKWILKLYIRRKKPRAVFWNAICAQSLETRSDILRRRGGNASQCSWSGSRVTLDCSVGSIWASPQSPRKAYSFQVHFKQWRR